MAKEIWSSEREQPIELISRLSDDYTLIEDVNSNPTRSGKVGETSAKPMRRLQYKKARKYANESYGK